MLPLTPMPVSARCDAFRGRSDNARPARGLEFDSHHRLAALRGKTGHCGLRWHGLSVSTDRQRLHDLGGAGRAQQNHRPGPLRFICLATAWSGTSASYRAGPGPATFRSANRLMPLRVSAPVPCSECRRRFSRFPTCRWPPPQSRVRATARSAISRSSAQ